MSLRPIMLEQLAIARRIIEDGHEVVPAWRIGAPDGAWLVLTRFDPDKPGQNERAQHLVRRFMVWKLAQSFVLAAETWLGSKIARNGEEAVIAVAASRAERLGVLQRIRRTPTLAFGPFQWLAPEQMDSAYSRMLPAREESITAEEAKALALIFGEEGELPAQKIL